jgi:hypothetical protein
VNPGYILLASVHFHRNTECCADHSMVLYTVTSESWLHPLALVRCHQNFLSYKVSVAAGCWTLKLSILPSFIPLSKNLLRLAMAPKSASKTPSKMSRLSKKPECVQFPEFQRF